MISELWHQRQPSRKLINTACRLRASRSPLHPPSPARSPPASRPLSAPFPSLSAGVSSFPPSAASSLGCAVHAPAQAGCLGLGGGSVHPACVGAEFLHTCSAVASFMLGKPVCWRDGVGLGLACAILQLHSLARNKLCFKCCRISLSPSSLLPSHQCYSSLPSFLFQ